MEGDIYFRKFFIKNGFRQTSDEGFHVYWSSPNIGRNRHSKTAIKIVGDANETIGSKPDGLPKVVAIVLKKKSLFSVEAEVTGHPHDAAAGKWLLGGTTKVPCIYRFYGPKKSKAEFRNTLYKVNKSI